MGSTLSNKNESSHSAVIIWFSVYSILLIIGAIVFTTSNENLNDTIKNFGKFAFISSPIILLYSIYFAIKKRVSNLLMLFCIFILPSIFFLFFELLARLFL